MKMENKEISNHKRSSKNHLEWLRTWSKHSAKLKEPIKWLQFDGRKSHKSSSKSISNISNAFLSDAEKCTKKDYSYRQKED
jgi:hypothetical protein